MHRFLLISAGILAFEHSQLLQTLCSEAQAILLKAYAQYGFGLLYTFACISIPLVISLLIDWKPIMRMFFSKRSGASRPNWEAFVILNWICSAIFTLSMTHLISESISGNGQAYTKGLLMRSNNFYFKLALVLGFLSLSYLVCFFGVSLVAYDMQSVSNSQKVGLISFVPPAFQLGVVAFVWTIDTSLSMRSILCVASMVFFAAIHLSHRVKQSQGTAEGTKKESSSSSCSADTTDASTKYKLFAANLNAKRNWRVQFAYDLAMYIAPITVAAIFLPMLRPVAHGLSLLFTFFLPVYMYLAKKVYFKSSVEEDKDTANYRLKTYPHPELFPNGWYHLVSSCELKSGDVKYVTALGKHYAVFRGQDGVVRCLDAHCIHMGANMAVGGKVKNNCLECPFHLWQFDGDGACTHIPYSKAPSQARTRSYHVREYYGNILVWYHTNEEGPAYDFPVLDKFTEGLMVEKGDVELEVNMHIQEFAENSADFQHFGPFHGESLLPMTDIAVPGFTINHAPGWKEGQGAEAHKASLLEHADLSFCGKRIPESAADPLITFVGPGSVVYFTFDTPIGSITAFQTNTPITPMRLKCSFRWYAEARMPRLLVWHVIGSWLAQWRNDICVWENKNFQKRPLLVKGDGPLQNNRRWFNQFYTPKVDIAYETASEKTDKGAETCKDKEAGDAWRSAKGSEASSKESPAVTCGASVAKDW
jgi:cholesterol 7-dehydrogenase